MTTNNSIKVPQEVPKEIIINTHDEVDQILGNPPSWILRWGLTLVLIAAVIFGLIAWLIKYPDVIPTKISIVTENPAIPVIAKSSGKINQLLVENNQIVKASELVAVLDNPIEYEDILSLESFVDRIDKIKNPNQYLSVTPVNDLNLGNIQVSYASLLQQIDDYKYSLQQQDLFERIQAIESQIKNTKLLSDNLDIQKSKLIQEIAINKKDVERNRMLNQEGAIPDNELEKIETQYLQYERQLVSMESQVVQNDITIDQLNAQILDLSQKRKDEHAVKDLTIKQLILRIKSEIEVWKKTFLITTPIAGKVSLAKIWNEHQFVNGGDEVLTIVPVQGVGKIIGKALLPVTNSGKVKRGQAANIRLNGFPFQEYGIIKSTVENISLVPKEENYLLDINLPDGLLTTYDKVIPFRQEMQGTAHIITEDRRVIERIFDRVLSIVKN